MNFERKYETPLNMKQKILLIVMDVLLLAELAFTFYRCSVAGGDLSETFLRTYVPMFIPTLVVFIYFVRKNRDPQPAKPVAE